MKICTQCKRSLPLSSFGRRGKNGTVKSWCRECTAADARRYNREGPKEHQPPKYVAEGVKRCSGCGKIRPLIDFNNRGDRPALLTSACKYCFSRRYADKAVQRYWKNRIAYLDAMGGRCVICGFDDYRALHTDHVNGGGCAEREALSSTSQAFYAKVLANRDDYQILCANHNAIKRIEEKECRRPRLYEVEEEVS